MRRHEAARGEALFETVYVAPQHGREVGVGDGRIAAPDEFAQRADFVRQRDLRETDPARDFADDTFVRAAPVGVHETHRDRAIPGVELSSQFALDRRDIQRGEHFTPGVQTFVRLDDG